VIIDTEPSGLMMMRYKFYFNRQTPDPEDPWVLAYLQEHGLEPRRELYEEYEGVPYRVFHFGQCYLGRHVEPLSELYKRGIEHTVLAQHLLACLEHTDDNALQMMLAGLDAAARKAFTTTLAVQLHATAQFETTEDNNLRVVLDPSIVHEAVLALREEGPDGPAPTRSRQGRRAPCADAVAEEDSHA
jgi:hypothetical protein